MELILGAESTPFSKLFWSVVTDNGDDSGRRIILIILVVGIQKFASRQHMSWQHLSISAISQGKVKARLSQMSRQCQGKFKAKSRHGQGKVKSNPRQRQGKVKVRSRQGRGRVKAM